MTSTPVTPMKAKDTTTFYLLPMIATVCFQAVNTWKNSDKEVMSGKRARKLGRIQRALKASLDEFQEQQKDLITTYREKYPEDHEKAGQFIPAYKLDEEGNETTEEDPTQTRLRSADLPAFQAEMMSMLGEPITVECPALLPEEIESILQLPANFVAAIEALEFGAETTILPSSKDEEEEVKEQDDEQVVGEIKPTVDDPEPLKVPEEVDQLQSEVPTT